MKKKFQNKWAKNFTWNFDRILKFDLKFELEFQDDILSRKMQKHEIFPENLQNFSYLKKKKNLWKERQFMAVVKEISKLYKETDDRFERF